MRGEGCGSCVALSQEFPSVRSSQVFNKRSNKLTINQCFVMLHSRLPTKVSCIHLAAPHTCTMTTLQPVHDLKPCESMACCHLSGKAHEPEKHMSTIKNRCRRHVVSSKFVPVSNDQ